MSVLNNRKKNTVVTFVKVIMLGIYFGISFLACQKKTTSSFFMILFSNTYFKKKTHIPLFLNSLYLFIQNRSLTFSIFIFYFCY
ncbi:hypothetical protein BDC45DRAFT_522378 [Circinella umbellata]|nr:hypothetical protein BDC45DRAFT_522378 [Circinella umbellata]